jgi:hypothetical protein
VKVIIYVEGPSDRPAMQALLEPLLSCLAGSGIEVEFIPAGNKKHLVLQVPVRAVNILLNDASAVVIALPDLYPQNVGFPHRTFNELAAGLHSGFSRVLERKRIDDVRLGPRFGVYCFKHDLEALLLAAETQMAARLGVSSVQRSWIVPVEDQDHNVPPKRVVESLFNKYGQRYRDTVDAPLILKAAHYRDIAAACPEGFGPLVGYLESLLTTDSPATAFPPGH